MHSYIIHLLVLIGGLGCRCYYQSGEVSAASHLVLLVLESVLKWAGVVDELDYAKRELHQYNFMKIL